MGTADSRSGVAPEIWGGLAAMLVALPSAIAFGVTIFSPLGAAGAGAVAGMVGATALGIVATAFGGTKRLITAPCAPAAAVLSALALHYAQKGIDPAAGLLMLALVALLCGVLQIFFGVARLGRLIKYMPYPVVSGYLCGVGLIIILGQIPKVTAGWQGLVVGGVTIAVMAGAPKVTKTVPAAILGLAAGILAYFGLALADASLLTLAGNKLVIGPLEGGGFFDAIVGRVKGAAALKPSDLVAVLVPAATLAVLLSIDTLKTCVVLDALTRSRHDSNRELIGQGLGNVSSTVLGGVPGAGQMGATLVNLASGGRTKLSGLVEGAAALVAFLLLSRLIAWIPVAALAGILIVVGARMFDVQSLQLLKSRSTVLDFVVIAAVVAVALTVGLVAASGVGVGLAILLFVREQVGGSVVRRKVTGREMFSKQVRTPEEMAVLDRRGEQTLICELQGSLFFGTADQLYRALEPELATRAYVVLDMRRVQSVDYTAVHILEQIEDMLKERGATLVFSRLPRRVPSGRDLEKYLNEAGLAGSEHRARVFEQRNEALEWIEERILAEEGLARGAESPMELREMEFFRGRKEETLAALEACVSTRSCKAGERIFRRGDEGDEIFLIRRGSVRIVLHDRNLATFGRGSFFGELSFLDRQPRSADAVAFADTDLFALSRAKFDVLSAEHKKLSAQLLEGIAKTIALRLRRANVELSALQEG